MIELYNKKFKFLATDIKYQGLAASAFEVPSYTTTLKAGETYARVPFKVKTEGLECDSLYAITFKIASSSAGYEIEAHQLGDIHIHDLDYYPTKTTTYCILQSGK